MKIKPCSIEGCDKPNKAKTYCDTHYRRWYEHGDAMANLKTIHNESTSVEYRTLKSMRDRCYLKSCAIYPRYGGRGIKICQRWLGKDGYLNFVSDMGRRPDGSYSIDRINNDGDYEPSNCRWATRSEQNSNRRTYTRRKRIAV